MLRAWDGDFKLPTGFDEVGIVTNAHVLLLTTVDYILANLCETGPASTSWKELMGYLLLITRSSIDISTLPIPWLHLNPITPRHLQQLNTSWDSQSKWEQQSTKSKHRSCMELGISEL